MALAASYACRNIPSNVEQMCRDVYSYLSASPLRTSRFDEIQVLLDYKPAKMLHPSATRWLSLEAESWTGRDTKIPQETEDDRAVVVLDYQRKGKRPVIKTTTRQTYFLLVIGLVDPEKLKPGDESEQGLVRRDGGGRTATEHYSDIGGLDKQIQELIQAVVLPMKHKDMFKNLRIHPPKGSTFLKLAGPQLVQMFIGDSFKLVRDAFIHGIFTD
ncbi:26S protease regulatory subunit 6a [Culex quinquefasciatus]|uniref:26S protease regulatory subunit 6a n=1 Tax=Culex quinquefasciatus TaxID=7176 RepID=B0W5Z5_CULQU|nr:26S protease regulatory subunit 6a [Culex quinquefasciatus]|eukprot:XP_001844129.1 26S protease regulatory subunit 6a [Culex quinquefasciatus]